MMKKILPVLFILIISSCSDPQSTSSDKLTERNNISYFGDSKNPFTGEIVDYHSNQNLKMTGNFVDGKKEGQWNIYYYHPKDGNPVQEYEEFYKDGKKDGIFLRLETTGTVRNSTEWVNGVFKEKIEYGRINNRVSFNEKTYEKNNKIYKVNYPSYEYVDENYMGEITCYITDKRTNQTIQHDTTQYTDGKTYTDKRSFETWKDCELNGESEKYWGGYIRSKGSYKDHKKIGKWIFYDTDTGDPSKIENYTNGQLDGLTQYFYDDSTILRKEESYKEGFKQSELSLNKDGELTSKKNWTPDGRRQVIEYTTVHGSYFNSGHPDFYRVLGTRWGYVDRICENDRWKENDESLIHCLSNQRSLEEPNLDPITITTSYLEDKKDGLFEISDTVDGHVYTSINYSRGGKLGDYKIINKDGVVVYSVTCLKGETPRLYRNSFVGGNNYEYPSSGNCRKDGEEITYKRTRFTKNKDWYPLSKIVYKDDRIVSSEFYRDPFIKKELLNSQNQVLLPYKEYTYIKSSGWTGLYVLPD
jgi:antitoxin component YwqK of YwqJK toxin-antitoxin module